MDSVLKASNGHFAFRRDFRNAKHLSVVLTNTVSIDDFCKQRRREIHLYIYGYRKRKSELVSCFTTFVPNSRKENKVTY